jgi:acyl-CoA synthetase (AMP-forming)/AMP-acid ligase II
LKGNLWFVSRKKHLTIRGGSNISPVEVEQVFHYVYGLWADRWQKRHAQGQIIIGRCADDIVMGFEHKGEARRFVADMRQRMEKFASKSCSRSATAWSV